MYNHLGILEDGNSLGSVPAFELSSGKVAVIKIRQTYGHYDLQEGQICCNIVHWLLDRVDSAEFLCGTYMINSIVSL